jgi:hypothetical protein
MNTIAKITIPVEKIYQAINDPQVLHAQGIIVKYHQEPVETAEQYNEMAYAIKIVNDVIKYIEGARKQVTQPLDLYKKEVIRLEQFTCEPMADFITKAKGRMVDYHNQQERIKAEAEAKIKAEAAAALKQAQSVSDIMASFTDKLFATSVETNKTANIRTTIKAQINGEVDWMKVLSVLFAANKITPDDLIKHLPAAMKQAGIDYIAGIELIEVKSQSIR